MKEIPLTQGQFAIVDDDDFDWLSQWKWCALKRKSGDFYAVRRKPYGGLLYMHKVILNITTGDTDHINLNKLDNRRSNLRPATRSQNMRNLNKIKRNGTSTSQYKGVYWRRNRWEVSIRLPKRTYLGSFDSEIDAAHAYDAAARDCFGEFARTNF